MEFPEGRGGLSWEPILENPERGRGHRKNPFRGGGGYGYFLEPHIAYAKNTRFFQPVCLFCKHYFSKLKSNPAKKLQSNFSQVKQNPRGKILLFF